MSMKKMFLMIGLLICMVSVFGQNDSPFQSTTVYTENQQELRIETYDYNYCYLKDMTADELIIFYHPDNPSVPVYDQASSFCRKYAGWTPGELIAQSGKLKNRALTVGVVTGLTASALIGCSFLMSEPMAMYIPGAVIGFGGAIVTVAILATSNKLLQEAGLKMQRIQLSANGLSVKF